MTEPFILAACVAVAAWAIAKEKLFEEPRKWLAARHAYCHDRFGACGGPTMLGWWLLAKATYLFTCEFCTSFWVTLVVTAKFGHRLLYDGFDGYVVAQFFTWALAVAYMSLYQLVRVDIRNGQADADRKAK